MQTYYKPVFIYTGEKPNKLICKRLESVFVDFHNAFAKMVNPMLDDWNKAYDGPNDLVDKDGCINSEGSYTKFMRKMYQPYADKLTKTLSRNSYIKRFLIGDELNLEMELRNGTVVDMLFEPVNV